MKYFWIGFIHFIFQVILVIGLSAGAILEGLNELPGQLFFIFWLILDFLFINYLLRKLSLKILERSNMKLKKLLNIIIISILGAITVSIFFLIVDQVTIQYSGSSLLLHEAVMNFIIAFISSFPFILIGEGLVYFFI